MRAFYLLVLWLMPVSLLAEAGLPEIAYSTYFVKLAISLLLIMILLAAMVWFSRRYGIGSFSSNRQSKNLKVISALSLGTREKIVMLDVNGDQLLLGVTPGEIRKLHLKRASASVEPFSTSLEKEIKKAGAVD